MDLNAIKSLFVDGTARTVSILVIIVLTIVLNRIFKRLMDNYFKRASMYMKVDRTQFNFFKHFISAMVYVIGFSLVIYSIPSLRTLSVSLFAGAGILAIIIGFASQQAFSNIVSGVMIIIFRPFRVGDRIKISADLRGKVEDITLRHTVIKDFENKRIIVPNSVIGSEIIENSTIEDEKVVRIIEFGISYDSDIDKAMKIMKQESEKHPDCLDNRDEEEKAGKEPIVSVRVIGFSDSSVNLRAWVWAKDPVTGFKMGTDLNRSIKLRFDKEGIEIPYPYRTIVFKKDIKMRSKKKR